MSVERWDVVPGEKMVETLKYERVLSDEGDTQDYIISEGTVRETNFLIKLILKLPPLGSFINGYHTKGIRLVCICSALRYYLPN